MGDDYNSVIEKLIIEHNRNSFLEYSRKIVTDRKEEFISVDEIWCINIAESIWWGSINCFWCPDSRTGT